MSGPNPNGTMGRLMSHVGNALEQLERADRKVGTEPARLSEAYLALVGAQTNIASALYELGRAHQESIDKGWVRIK